MHVGLDEWDEVRPSLADDEVVDVEQLGNTSQRRVSVRVGRVRPMPKIDRVGRRPRNNVPLGVLAEHRCLAAAI